MDVTDAGSHVDSWKLPMLLLEAARPWCYVLRKLCGVGSTHYCSGVVRPMMTLVLDSALGRFGGWAGHARLSKGVLGLGAGCWFRDGSLS